MKISQYVPGFASGSPVDEHTEADFAEMSYLKDVSFVEGWMEGDDFLKLSVASGTHLMAELKNGKFWVIGIFHENYKVLSELPIWSYDECKKRESQWDQKQRENQP